MNHLYPRQIANGKNIQKILSLLQACVQCVRYTKILEVNLFTFAYRLFHEDFSSIDACNGASIEDKSS